jgi:hypothetical protein
MNAVNTVLAVLALAELAKHEPQPVPVTHHKELVKRDRTPKAKRAGRGKPAKGYDPLTKTWIKP